MLLYALDEIYFSVYHNDNSPEINEHDVHWKAEYVN